MHTVQLVNPPTRVDDLSHHQLLMLIHVDGTCDGSGTGVAAGPRGVW